MQKAERRRPPEYRRDKKQGKYGREEKGKTSENFFKQIVVQTSICLVILVLAFVLKNSDSDFSRAAKDVISQNLNESTSAEAISVFLGDVSEKYDDLKNRAVAVFSPSKIPESQAEEGKNMANENDVSENKADEIIKEAEPTEALFEDIPEYSDSPSLSVSEHIKKGPVSILETNTLALISKIEAPEPTLINAYFDIAPEEDIIEIPVELGDTPVLPFDLLTPVMGTITSEYGIRINPVTKKEAFHKGIDIAASKNTPIKAVYDGVVREVGINAAFGNYVKISHKCGTESFYAHCNSVDVKEGDTVKTGDVIAKVGTTGWSTGDHLHFEIRKDGVSLPPRAYLNSSYNA